MGITVDACNVYEDGRILCTAVMPEDAERIALALNATRSLAPEDEGPAASLGG